jgi:hypothetical protein
MTTITAKLSFSGSSTPFETRKLPIHNKTYSELLELIHDTVKSEELQVQYLSSSNQQSWVPIHNELDWHRALHSHSQPPTLMKIQVIVQDQDCVQKRCSLKMERYLRTIGFSVEDVKKYKNNYYSSKIRKTNNTKRLSYKRNSSTRNLIRIDSHEDWMCTENFVDE